ncbi:MAG: hypothetical protein DSZ18_03335, partial [Candidatus Thioglobus sp.]
MDIIEELSLDSEVPLSGNNMPIYTKYVDNTPSVLLKCLSYKAMSIDEMVEKSGLSPQVITQELLLLELANRVTKVG